MWLTDPQSLGCREDQLSYPSWSNQDLRVVLWKAVCPEEEVHPLGNHWSAFVVYYTIDYPGGSLSLRRDPFVADPSCNRRVHDVPAHDICSCMSQHQPHKFNPLYSLCSSVHRIRTRADLGGRRRVHYFRSAGLTSSEGYEHCSSSWPEECP